MNRTALNFVVDTAAFVGFVLLTATGVLMHYLLPPGSGHHTAIWGLDRHDWGQVHFWIFAVFLGTLTLHLCLHWRWVAALVRALRLLGLPPWRPLARAASSPALVRSWIRLRSNSASAPKMWNCSCSL